MTNQQIYDAIKNSHFWKSGDVMTTASIAALAERTPGGFYDRKRASQAIGDLIRAGEAERIEPGRYRRRSTSYGLLTRPWRTLSDEEVGIKPAWLEAVS